MTCAPPNGALVSNEQPPDGIPAIRRVAARLEASEGPVLRHHAAGLPRYEEDAPLGRTLDEALGVAARGGAGPWWVQEARAPRSFWAEDGSHSHPTRRPGGRTGSARRCRRAGFEWICDQDPSRITAALGGLEPPRSAPRPSLSA